MATEETKPVEREAFERWAQNNELPTERLPDGEYCLMATDWGWAAWQASADAAPERAAPRCPTCRSRQKSEKWCVATAAQWGNSEKHGASWPHPTKFQWCVPCNDGWHAATARDWAMRVAERIIMLCGGVKSGEQFKRHISEAAALIREAGSEREHRLRTSLQTHWLAQIECNHHEKNDSAICACGWKSDQGFNVGKAVEFWIDHVWAEASRLLGGESK